MTSLAAARRPGLTLTEVLVAMFVMALGLISLLTLFPLGAVQIGFALRDDRCAQTAIQADAFLRAWWQAKIVEPSNTGNPPAEAAFWAMDDPNLVIQRKPNTSATTTAPPTTEANSPAGVRVNQYVQQLLTTTTVINNTNVNAPISPTSLYGDLLSATSAATADTLLGNGSAYYTVPPANPPATGNVPSYPVFIDPITVRAKNGSPDATWVGYASASASGTIPLLVPRRELTMVTNANTLATPTCSLLDDLTFGPNGVPEATATLISRQGRYNWSAVVQRPANNNRATATLTILVFDGRPPGLNIPGSEVVVKLSTATDITNANWSAGKTSVTLTLTAPTDPNAPAIVRRGGWFMDGTVSPGGVRTAQFYRIVGLTPDPAVANKYQLDIDPPISSSASGTPPVTLYFFAGLAEVFVRPPLTPNPAPGQ